MHLDEIRKRLASADISKVAKAVEMSQNAIRYIMTGRTRNPWYGTVQKLAAYFRGRK